MARQRRGGYWSGFKANGGCRHARRPLLGAAAGPLAYYSGARLGGMALLEPLPALLVLALGWSLALALLLS